MQSAVAWEYNDQPQPRRYGVNSMAADERPTVPPILLPFAPMNKRALGLATGIVLGTLVWLATIILVLKGGPHVGPTLSLLSQYFYGYRVTAAGSFVGLAWVFALGYILGWVFAALRNALFRAWLEMAYSRAELEEYGDILDRLR